MTAHAPQEEEPEAEVDDILPDEAFLPPPTESRPDDPPEFRDVRHEALRFTAPKSWEDRSLLTVIEAEGGGFRHNITVGLEPTGMQLDTYARIQLELLGKSLPGSEIGKPVRRTTKAGTPFMEVRVKVKLPDSPPAQQIQAFFVVKGNAYTVTCSAQEEAFDVWREKVFEPVLSSIRFGP